MTQRTETTIKSNHDGLELGLTIIRPDQPPRSILQIVHGMAEHRRRYYDFMEFCAKQGLVTIIHDHRGHGDSIQNHQDIGYFYHNGAQGMINDVHQVTEYIRTQYPDLPLTLLGHSMGSLVVRCYLKQYDQDIDRLIVCGSPSKNLAVRAGRALVRTLKLFRGDHYRSNLVSNLFNRNFSKRFPNEGSINSWIVSDPAVVAAYDADEKSGFNFTLNGYENLLTLSLMTYSKHGWQLHHPDLPILFIAGADDPCIISHKDFQKAVSFMNKVGYRDVESKLYPGMRHEILNERDKQLVWDDVTSWINTGHLAKNSNLSSPDSNR